MRADRTLVVLRGATGSALEAQSDERIEEDGSPGRSSPVGPTFPDADELGMGWLALRSRPLLLAAACGLVALGVGYLLPTRPKDAVALVVAAAVIVAVLLRPVVGAVLLVAVVPATSGFAPGFPVSNVRISEAVIGLVGVTLLATVRRTESVPWETLDWALLAYGLAWAVCAVLAARQLHEHLTISDWGTAIGQLQFFLIYRGVRTAVRSSRERRLALAALMIASLPVAALAILQEMRLHAVQSFINHLTGGLTAGTAPTGAGTVARVTGPFINWAALAGYLLPIVLVVLALAVSKADMRRARWFATVGVAAALAMMLTLEQSAIVCALVGAFMLVRRYDRTGRATRLFLVVGAIVIVVASPVLIGRLSHELGASPGTGRIPWVPETLSFRWSIWTKQYFPAIWARPLTGYGTLYPTTISWAAPESQYISFLMEGGVVMVIFFGVLAWAMLRRTVDAARGTDPQDHAIGYALTICVVSMLVMNLTWPFLSNGGMPQVVWALMALLLPARRPQGTSVGALWKWRGLETSGTRAAAPGTGGAGP